MNDYTNMIHHEEYVRWRDVQDVLRPIPSYEEWLRSIKYPSMASRAEGIKQITKTDHEQR